MLKIISILTVSIILTTTFFVNCGGPAPKSLDDLSSQQSLNTESENNMNPIGSNGLVGNSNGNSQTNGNNQDANTSNQANQKIQVAIQTNEAAQKDCSSAQASLIGEIRNAEPDVRACAEFILDLPLGSQRHGEYYYCDSPSKFDNMVNKTDWVYDAATRKWTIKGGQVLTRNNYLVPGIYRMIVLDKDNNRSESAWVNVVRKGHENCSSSSPSSGVTPQKKHFWTAIVAGPVQPPTSPTCGAGNVGAQTMHSGYVWTCVYQ